MARVKLTRKKEVADKTMAFWFEKPKGFEYEAGQFVEVTLIEPPETDGKGNSRTFTLASAPREDELQVATRMRDSAFKRVLGNGEPDTEVEIEGPYGKLTLPEDGSRPVVFIAGGIGITPFRSMAVEAARQKLPHSILLFYANRRPEDAAFLEELRTLEQRHPTFQLVATMTEPERSSRKWEGEIGRINRKMLERHLDDLKENLYFVAGPPGLVNAMQKLLREAGVSKDNIKAEQFAGY